MEIGLAKLMEANGLDLLVQKVQERLSPHRTAEAGELLKQGMRIGGPMSRVPGEPMTSYISRRRRWWTLVHEMDNTLELGDTVQGSMMLEQAGLSRFEQNMVLTYTKGQRTVTAIAEAQHYDVHHRGRETPTPTGNSSSPNRWRRRDTTRAHRAEAEPIKELTDITAYGEEGISDDCDGEQDEEEDDEIHETDFAALLGNSGEDPEADDAWAEALQLDAVAMVAWQRFNGKGKGKGKGKGQRQRQRQEQRQQSVFRGAQEMSCPAEEPYQLSSVRCAWTLGRRRHLSQECQEREYIAITCTRISDCRRRNIRFRPRLDR